MAKSASRPDRLTGGRIELPKGWWDRLIYEIVNRDSSIKDFCGKAKITRKTLQRAQASGWMTRKTLSGVAGALGFLDVSNLLADWSEGPSRLRKLEAAESATLEERYVALSKQGVYDEAAELASTALARAEQSSEPSIMAHWADRTADAYRTMGSLRKASSFYARAWVHVQAALTKAPSDLQLRYQAGKTRFGQIVVDDFLIRGSFREALSRHSHLLTEAQLLELDAGTGALAREIRTRRTHIRRQQAEMLRLLGRYGESLALIRDVLADYPQAFFEARAYARLSEADSLRLQGEADAAVGIYEELEQLARDRGSNGLLGSVLWRLACALPLSNRTRSRDEVQAEVGVLAKLHGDRYRFMKLYCCLAGAAGPVHDRRAALRLLEQAEKFGPIDANYLVMEYGHLELCRGEILRAASPSEALSAFMKSLSAYGRTECRWGQIRSWIGVQLTGTSASPPLPAGLRGALEGCDRELLDQFDKGRPFQGGTLSVNLP